MVLGKERARRIARLATAKGRREEGSTLLDSRSLIEEGLRVGLVQELFVASDGWEREIAAAEARGVPVTSVTSTQLGRLADVETSPGAIAVARIPDPAPLRASLAVERLAGVLLDHVSEPGNVGTIARSAAAFGFDILMVSPGCADPFSPKALRASAGALLTLPVAPLDWDAVVDAGVTCYRTVVRGGRQLRETAFAARSLLWLGNEAHGVGAAPTGLRFEDVTIPLRAASESLNVAAAAAIVCHHLDGLRRA